MEKFSVALDLNFFQPSEMSVKLVDNSIVVVEAKHSERPDEKHGSIARHFLHRYRLPNDIDPESLISNLSDKGILTISAEKKEVLMADCMNEEYYDETYFIRDNYEHPNPGLFYTITRIPGKDSPEMLFEQLDSCCQCRDAECTVSNNCSCLKSGPNYKKIDNMLVLEEDKFGNSPVFECNFRCLCFEVVKKISMKSGQNYSCQNRCVQFGPLENLEIFSTSKKGLGLKTNRKIPLGTFICEYAGEVIGVGEAKRRQKMNISNKSMNYIFVLNEYFRDSDKFITCIDPTLIGNIGRYINHSCQPNASVVPVRVNNLIPLLCVFALRDIQENEEITFEYSGYNDNSANLKNIDDRKPCFCNSDACKKWLPFQAY